jgi:hypothetical protein
VPVTLAKAAVVALYRGLDQTRGVAGGTLETILTEGDGNVPGFSALCMIDRGFRVSRSHVLLNGGTDQRAQFFVGHSTHSS